MAFSQVAASANSSEDSDTTSHTVSLPADIQAGDLLIVFFVTDGDNTITDWDGFTEIFSMDESGPACHLSVAYKKATGSEGASITVTTSSSEKSAHISYRITGHEDPATQAPEASTGVDGNDQNPDPDSLTPTSGAKDYLWFAVEGNDDVKYPTNYPTSYTNGEYETSGGISGQCNVGVARRELNDSVEDPGTFTLDAVDRWVACTVVVHPGAGFIPKVIMI